MIEKRLFTFGCSFTKYHWATWADILGQEFKEHHNWGKVGGGNLFILCSLIEAIQRESINEKDTVIIMWSSPGREDRWVNGEWITPGSIYNQETYPEDWVKKFADPKGYLIRDAALIHTAMNTLENINCDHYMLSMAPFAMIDDSDKGILQKIKSKFNLITGVEQKDFNSTADATGILKMYQDTFNKIRPSVYEVIFNNDWYSRSGFATKTWIETSYRDSRETWAPHWPEYEDFITKHVSDPILEEIKQSYDFDDLDMFLNEIHRFEKRDDRHPTPIEHLEYIEKVLPEFSLSQETKQWAQSRQLDAEKRITFKHEALIRF